MTAQEYYNFFASKPEDQWIIGTMENEDGRRCAVGWIRKDLRLYTFEAGLRDLFIKHEYLPPENINDGFKDTQVFGDTPRERILTVLSQIILFEAAANDRSEVAPELATVAA